LHAFPSAGARILSSTLSVHARRDLIARAVATASRHNVGVTTTPRHGRLLRVVFLALGLVCVSFAVVGIVMPIIPVTGPTLLAAYFFARSSPRFDRWLTNHRWFGPIVRDWRAGVGFTRRAKAVAVGAIAASFLITGTVAVHSAIGRVALTVLAVSLCAYILTRPTKPADQQLTGEPSGR
jgi:hypothetical protein